MLMLLLLLLKFFPVASIIVIEKSGLMSIEIRSEDKKREKNNMALKTNYGRWLWSKWKMHTEK